MYQDDTESANFAIHKTRNPENRGFSGAFRNRPVHPPPAPVPSERAPLNKQVIWSIIFDTFSTLQKAIEHISVYYCLSTHSFAISKEKVNDILLLLRFS